MSKLWQLISSDVVRVQGRSGLVSTLKALATKRCWRVIFTLRLSQAAAASGPARWLLLPPALLAHTLARWMAGLDLPWQTQIGYGFRIDHGWAVVINAGSRIGNNVTLFHGVTLGQRDRVAADGSRTTDYPVIEDNAWLGPHAVVAGARIGQGSRLAAGAFVSDDVPAHSLVVGNPARVVKQGVPADVMYPAALPVPGAPAAVAVAATEFHAD